VYPSGIALVTTSGEMPASEQTAVSETGFPTREGLAATFLATAELIGSRYLEIWLTATFSPSALETWTECVESRRIEERTPVAIIP